MIKRKSSVLSLVSLLVLVPFLRHLRSFVPQGPLWIISKIKISPNTSPFGNVCFTSIVVPVFCALGSLTCPMKSHFYHNLSLPCLERWRRWARKYYTQQTIKNNCNIFRNIFLWLTWQTMYDSWATVLEKWKRDLRENAVKEADVTRRTKHVVNLVQFSQSVVSANQR